MPRVTDLHVVTNTALPAPQDMVREIPRTETHAEFVAKARGEIENILSGKDERLLVIVGPCSIHELKAGREYAERLATLAQEVKERMLLVMRVYFEKPRTSLGWKGLIMDPHLDGTNDIPGGLRLARTFLRDVLDCGVATATEMLDPITPQYIADLTCWSAIGARTVESQTHRQMASGLSMPVGFKNATSGAVLPAINAIKAATQPQTFLGISEDGRASVVNTTGNAASHLILRGGEDGPNFDADSVSSALAALEKHKLPPVVMIDASHANCGKDCTRMPDTFREIVRQRVTGTRGIIGAMLESNLVAGAQNLGSSREGLVYGQSITDQCMDWETTQELIRKTAGRLPGVTLGQTVFA
ncbi:3-deoxy-7-phosphoheptulonate synthase [Roseimicrobium sp. ORNL1]|uniref:3-deoxy-7-phosphoheptulonate synthase n=1 Tax=Roseimicrobium sp. ORNL1 TaxID=2711231 RepID=UPI0013E0ECEB|nr:3-deoxy-7-phosphoheptulonate synthase [Roseimicrobium sp. ORNL1]QIF00506.1 3-deoxy-7-phosphoheptulonate synthase [Roseimicrobium sp. ORNL1]